MNDNDAYRRTVLDPARAAGNLPPADLFVRYGLAPDQPQPDSEFAKRVEEVVRYWRTLKQQRKTYAKVVEALLVGHRELERAGQLNPRAFAEAAQERTATAVRRLDQAIAVLAETTPCVSRATLDHLVAGSGGACSEAEVRKRLTACGIRVAEEAWPLPGDPPSAGYRMLRGNLDLLGMRLSADLVAGAEAIRRGFRLRAGFRLTTDSAAGPAGPLTAEMIAGAVRRAAGRSRDESKTATDGVLAALGEAARTPGRLDELLLWEVLERLRPAVAAGLPVKLIAAEARALGLVADEAAELALALAGGPAGTGAGGLAGEIELALAEDRLREAERLIGGLPAEAEPELRDQVLTRTRRVAELGADATGRLSAGEPEAAAELLAAATRIAADDDDLAARLRAIPAPAVLAVRADGDAGRVGVAWTPGPLRVGPVRYRVVRTDNGRPAGGASSGALVAETDANEVIDPAPPVATDVVYTVFAGRAEGIWSTPAASPPVRILPEVGDLTMMADERQVTATWQAHPETTEVLVIRIGGDGRAKELRPETVGRAGFVDDTVTPGETYRYRVQAGYTRPDGRQARSPGLVVTASPEPQPEPVTDLVVEITAGRGQPVAELSWVPPASGRVVVRTSAGPPPWTSGSAVAPADVERYGRAIPGIPSSGDDGRVVLTAPLTGGRGHFAAVSLGAGRAVAGATVVIRMADPVRELTARRLGDMVTLSWIWPEGVQQTEVTWAPADNGADRPGGPQTECGRRAYEDDGGCHLTVGPGPVRVSVRAVARDPGGSAVSPAATITVPGIGTKVSYEFRRGRLPRWRAAIATLVLRTERPCRLPPLAVVHHTGPVMPIRADQGRVIHQVPGCDLGPAEPLTVRVSVPPPRGSKSWLVCFVDGGLSDAVTLTRLPGTW